jgi:hypothetical protein
MDAPFSSYEQALLNTLARVRGLRPEMSLKYPQLRGVRSLEAARKRFERMEIKGLLAKSNLPTGPQIFRLSRRGVQLTGAPSSFADAPTQSVAYEMIAVSACGWRNTEFLFLTRQELVDVCTNLHPGFAMERFPGRFLLRTGTRHGNESELAAAETHLHFWIAEFKPAEQLARRIEVASQQLAKSSPFFAQAFRSGVMGISVAVPTAGVKATLKRSPFKIEVSIEVVQELAAFAAP